MDCREPFTDLDLVKKRLRGQFVNYLVITLVHVRRRVIFVPNRHRVVTPKKEESMNKVGWLCKLDWSSCQAGSSGVPTGDENQADLIPWAPRDRADLCEKCTRVLVLTKFWRSGVPNFVKIKRGYSQFLTRIYGFLWRLNFRFPIVPLSVLGLSNLTEICFKLVTTRVPAGHQPEQWLRMITETDRERKSV